VNSAALQYQAACETSNQTLAWAVAISICLHLIAVLYIPNIRIHVEDSIPEVLTIQIEAPKTPEPSVSTVVEPEPIPEPPKPNVQPKIEPKIIPTSKPAPIETYEPQNVSPESQEDYSPPVMSVAPTIEAQPPTFTAPPPPPPPVGPSQADIEAARKGYADRLARAIAQHKQYPRVAQMRGWQGEVIVDLKLDRNGGVLVTKIDRSSGFEVLDKQALEMVKKAAPFPAPPEILKSDVFNIQVPVSFKLE
jgi:periplasmic protein TonB